MRLETIEKLQTKVAAEINSRLQETVVEILVEGEEKGKWYGRTRGDKLVFFSSTLDYYSQPVSVRIIRTSPWSLTGSVVVSGNAVRAKI